MKPQSTAKNDIGYKKGLYEKCEVKAYWIIDTENRLVEVYRLMEDKYKLDMVYVMFHDYMIDKMTEEEKSAIVFKFKTSLFSDFIIDLEDVFENIMY